MGGADIFVHNLPRSAGSGMTGHSEQNRRDLTLLIPEPMPRHRGPKRSICARLIVELQQYEARAPLRGFFGLPLDACPGFDTHLEYHCSADVQLDLDRVHGKPEAPAAARYATVKGHSDRSMIANEAQQNPCYSTAIHPHRAADINPQPGGEPCYRHQEHRIWTHTAFTSPRRQSDGGPPVYRP